MTDHTDLIQRLRAHGDSDDIGYVVRIVTSARQAADALEAQAAQIAELEAHLAEAERPKIAVTKEMQERFEAWFVENYPGPNTIIHNPHWHAPKVFRAALYCVSRDDAEKALAEAERRGAERMRKQAEAEISSLIRVAETSGVSVPKLFKLGAEAGLDQALFALHALPLPPAPQEGE